MRDTMFDFSLSCVTLISAGLAFCPRHWTNFSNSRLFHLNRERELFRSFDQKGTYASPPFFPSMIYLIGLDPPDICPNINEDQSCAKCCARNYELILSREEAKSPIEGNS